MPRRSAARAAQTPGRVRPPPAPPARRGRWRCGSSAHASRPTAAPSPARCCACIPDRPSPLRHRSPGCKTPDGGRRTRASAARPACAARSGSVARRPAPARGSRGYSHCRPRSGSRAGSGCRSAVTRSISAGRCGWPVADWSCVRRCRRRRTAHPGRAPARLRKVGLCRYRSWSAKKGGKDGARALTVTGAEGILIPHIRTKFRLAELNLSDAPHRGRRNPLQRSKSHGCNAKPGPVPVG